MKRTLSSVGRGGFSSSVYSFSVLSTSRRSLVDPVKWLFFFIKHIEEFMSHTSVEVEHVNKMMLHDYNCHTSSWFLLPPSGISSHYGARSEEVVWRHTSVVVRLFLHDMWYFVVLCLVKALPYFHAVLSHCSISN